MTAGDHGAGGVTQGSLLGGKIQYRQFAAGHRSGFEPVLLAASIPARPGDHVLEAGTGAGAALLCLAARVPGLNATGVELVPGLAGLANENFRINGLHLYSALNRDIGEAALGARFDHVMANPPWHDDAGTQSPDARRALAHHADPSLLERWIVAMTRNLRPRGSLTLILPAAQHNAASSCLREAGFGELQLFPLWPQAGQPAKLVIISARLGRQGADRILAGLVLHDAAGITEAAQSILRDGAPTKLAG